MNTDLCHGVTVTNRAGKNLRFLKELKVLDFFKVFRFFNSLRYLDY